MDPKSLLVRQVQMANIRFNEILCLKAMAQNGRGKPSVSSSGLHASTHRHTSHMYTIHKRAGNEDMFRQKAVDAPLKGNI